MSSERMMRAMVLERPARAEEGPLILKEVPVPRPGPGEVLVRVETCGVCHTDLHTVEGELKLPRLPIIPGHQIVGVVAEKGEGAKRFHESERAGIAWLSSACGRCRFCQSGRENLCQSARFTGLDVDGGYAEFAVVQEAFAYKIPKGFSARKAAPLLCAGIIGYRALRLSEIRPGGKLGLYGFGASAHLVIQIARHWNCKIFVLTRSAEHKELATKLGADWVRSSEDEPPEKLDGAIIFAPVGQLVLYALRALDRGGRLALAGIEMSPIPEMNYREHLYYERTIRSVTASTRRDGEDFLRLAEELPLAVETTTFPMERADEALKLLKEGKMKGAGVLMISDCGVRIAAE